MELKTMDGWFTVKLVTKKGSEAWILPEKEYDQIIGFLSAFPKRKKLANGRTVL